MATCRFNGVVIGILFVTATVFAQQPKELVQQAQQYLDRSDYTMAAELLAKALNKIQNVLLNDLKASLPDAPNKL